VHFIRKGAPGCLLITGVKFLRTGCSWRVFA